tara:strand:+ start:1376 stop:2227 length:852 start_codon:yes stop_codon:yes gene_type:complete
MNNNEDFLYIEDSKNDIYRLIRELNSKCVNLEELYKEYLQEVLKHDGHLMSLDVLFFQIELTYEDIENYTNLFTNFLAKMYGMYYKLYIKIIHSLKDIKLDNIFDKDIFIKFTPFDDLNKKEYKFEEIQRVHNTITSIINSITQYISRQKYSIEDDEVKTNKGININQLVFEKTHDNEILLQKTKLFNNIITNYYDYQKKFMKRMTLKLKVLYFQLDSDIEFQTLNKKESKQYIDLQPELTKNKDFESVILNQLDITQSPTSRKETEKKNLYNVFIDSLARCM